MVKTIIFSFGYDGSGFNGWQSQPNKRTIQGEFDKAFQKIFKFKPKSIISGRTDTGVHAKNQLVSININEIENTYLKVPKEKLTKIFNDFLPEDIFIINSNYLDFEFNARFDAIAREYSYICSNQNNTFTRNYEFQIKNNKHNKFIKYNKNIDVDLLNQASKILIGKHDFTTFSKVNLDVANYICDVEFAYWKNLDENRIEFRIKANRFVYSMVRNLVANLLMLSANYRGLDIAEFEKNFKSMNRNFSFGLAPANGLYFEKVYYEDDLILF